MPALFSITWYSGLRLVFRYYNLTADPGTINIHGTHGQSIATNHNAGFGSIWTNHSSRIIKVRVETRYLLDSVYNICTKRWSEETRLHLNLQYLRRFLRHTLTSRRSMLLQDVVEIYVIVRQFKECVTL